MILADIFLALFVAWVIHVVAFIQQINRKKMVALTMLIDSVGQLLS